MFCRNSKTKHIREREIECTDVCLNVLTFNIGYGLKQQLIRAFHGILFQKYLKMYFNIKYNKKRRNATKPGFQRFNQVLMWQEEEMKDGSEEKQMPLFWLHWLHVPSLVSISQSKLKLLSENWISILVTVTLTLITDTWVAIPICHLI